MDPAALKEMTDILAHRGPDGVEIWASGPVGLGHRMLWTTPESLHETLPFADSAAGLTITADARIDNRDELLPLLNLTDRPAEMVSDSQVILAAYQKWGEDCPTHLLGDFAFAIWDEAAQQLFCARDHFGVRPFYYYLSDEMFAFATEIKALLTLPDVPQVLNERRVAQFMISREEEPTNTFYTGILRLERAHTLSVRRNAAPLQCYYEVRLPPELHLGSDQEYADRFREIFTEAVRCRLRSAFPVGSMLSGGLDSSAITCVARNFLSEEGKPPLATFSAVYDVVTASDESEFVEAVVAQGDLAPHYVHPDKASPMADIDSLLWHLDEPNQSGNLYLNCLAYKVAQSEGVRIILDGFDGDSTVSHGLGYLRELALQKRWLMLASVLRHYAPKIGQDWRKAWWNWVTLYGIEPTLSQSKVFTRLRHVRQRRRAVAAGADSSGQNGDREGESGEPRHTREGGNITEEMIISPNFARRQDLPKPNNAQHEAKTEREAHFHRLFWPSIPLALEGLNKAAAAYTLEIRHPFWDKRLIEFCLSVPTQQKIVGGWTRMILRRAMAGVLPQEVQWRPGKADHAHGFGYGLRQFEHDALKTLLVSDAGVLEPYVDGPVLTEAFRRFSSQDALEVYDTPLWRAISLRLWLQRSCTHNKPDWKGGEHHGKENLHSSRADRAW